MKKKLKIRFRGEITFDETPDDRGSVDVWLLNTLKDTIEHNETDEIYDILKLEWTCDPKEMKSEKSVKWEAW